MITTFPTLKSRKYVKPIDRSITLEVFCYCRLPDDGNTMVHCELCDEWFHHDCIKKKGWATPVDNEDWICGVCS